MKILRASTLLVILVIILFLHPGVQTYLNDFFSNNFSFVKKPKIEEKEVTLLLTGDVMLGRSVNFVSLGKNQPEYPFLKVSEKLSSADILFINLENPIIPNCPSTNTGMVFCADKSAVKALTFAGVDVVTLANNHTLNHGKEGLEKTVDLLNENGIDSTGRSNLVVKTLKGTKFGFLGFEKSQQTKPVLTKAEKDLILNSDSQVDVLVVAMHWGVEYQDKALPGVRELAKEIVNLGADVIVGHHPHWVQDYERINGKPVYYSLGNFVFDQMWSEETKKGLAVELKFKGKEVVSEEFSPTYIKEIGQPQWVLTLVE